MKPSRIGSVQVGDRVRSSAGWVGTVLSIRRDTAIPQARVQWDKSGSIGTHIVTKLHKV